MMTQPNCYLAANGATIWHLGLQTNQLELLAVRPCGGLNEKIPGETHFDEHMHNRFINAIKREANKDLYQPLSYSVNASTSAEEMCYEAYPSANNMVDAIHYELTSMDIKKMKAAAQQPGVVANEKTVIMREHDYRSSLQSTLCLNAMTAAYDLSSKPGDTTASTIGTMQDINSITAQDLCDRYDVLERTGQFNTCAFFMVGGQPQDALDAIQQRLAAKDIRPINTKLVNSVGMPRNRRKLQQSKLEALSQKRMQVHIAPDAPPGGVAFFAFPCDEAGTPSHVAQHAVLHALSRTDGNSPMQNWIDNNVISQVTAMPSDSPSQSVCLIAVAGGNANTMDKYAALLHEFPNINITADHLADFVQDDFNKQKQLQAARPIKAMKRLAAYNKPPQAWTCKTPRALILNAKDWARAKALMRCGVCCVAMQGPPVPRALPTARVATTAVFAPSSKATSVQQLAGVQAPTRVRAGDYLQLDSQKQGVMMAFLCNNLNIEHEVSLLRLQGTAINAKQLGSAEVKHEAHTNYMLLHVHAPKAEDDFAEKLKLCFSSLDTATSVQEHVSIARACAASLGSQLRDGTRINVHAVAPHILPPHHPLQMSVQDKFSFLQQTTPQSVLNAWQDLKSMPVMHFSYNTKINVNKILQDAGFAFTQSPPPPVRGVPVPSEDFTVPTQAIPAQIPTTDFAAAVCLKSNAHEAAKRCVQTELGGNCFSTEAMRAMRVGLTDGVNAMHVGPLAYGVQCGRIEDALFVAVKTPQKNVHNVNKAITNVIDRVMHNKLDVQALKVTQNATWDAHERHKATPEAAFAMLMDKPEVAARKRNEMLQLKSIAPAQLGVLMAEAFANTALIKVAAVPHMPEPGLQNISALPQLQHVARLSKH